MPQLILIYYMPSMLNYLDCLVIYSEKTEHHNTTYLLHKTNLNEKSVLFVIVLLFWSYMEEVLP